uniref:Uncharacterized protein n=1 Tax=Fagus sylvatica TaxID=28930 RepID=A0A2N9H3L4_FAGSY
MEVLESRELLLSLSESIAFHRLPSLETNAVITKAKGANVYSWDDRRGFLCFARKKPWRRRREVRSCHWRSRGGSEWERLTVKPWKVLERETENSTERK